MIIWLHSDFFSPWVLEVCNFAKKILQHRCFFAKFARFLRTPILKNIWEQLLLNFTRISCSAYSLSEKSTEFLLVRIFLYSVRIQKNAPYLDAFQAVIVSFKLSSTEISWSLSMKISILDVSKSVVSCGFAYFYIRNL